MHIHIVLFVDIAALELFAEMQADSADARACLLYTSDAADE